MPDPRLSPRRPRRQCGNPPAGHCCIRQCAFPRRLPPFAPAPQQKGGDAGAFCCELQSAARHRRKRPDFADHCDNAWGTQPLLHRPQNLGIARSPDQNDPLRIEPVRRKSGSVKIRARQTPQHHPVFEWLPLRHVFCPSPPVCGRREPTPDAIRGRGPSRKAWESEVGATAARNAELPPPHPDPLRPRGRRGRIEPLSALQGGEGGARSRQRLGG